ncbi:MAG: hypothetical protein KVP17_002305 [Porospora cf. gigantea B]|uniref:uncharacterized protein n=1 Tax=Porospora cf. gigantea B TaxID=2853592 RepID=UPI00357180A4|nr:MAG: hypothetical protein KVP17_002305 [Porospora cf. gigantea B]
MGSWLPVSDDGSVALTVPENEIVEVEVPGEVVDTGDEVIEALGGVKAIQQSLVAKNPLVLRVDPHDPYTRVIPATAVKTASVLIRVRVFASGKKEVLPLGTIRKSFQFESLADFYLPTPSNVRPKRIHNPDGSVSQQLPSLEEYFEANVPVDTPLWVPPPMFSRNTHPYIYNYEGNALSGTARYCIAGKDEDLVSSVLNPRSKNEGLNVVVKHDDPVWPSEPPPRAPLASEVQQVVEEVSKLLNERPLWTRQALEQYIPHCMSSWKRKPLYSQTCLLIMDGPWRGCLCRFGYDPRQDPAARVYQSIDFRDTFFRTTDFRMNKATDDPPDTKALLSFSAPPSKPSQLYQLIDITEPAIKMIVTSAPHTATCSKECKRPRNG